MRGKPEIYRYQPNTASITHCATVNNKFNKQLRQPEFILCKALFTFCLTATVPTHAATQCELVQQICDVQRGTPLYDREYICHCFFFSNHFSTQTPLEALQEQCNTTSATNSHVVLRLEHAQSLLLQFSEGLAEVSPWLQETQALIGQLSLSTISYEAFREQQELLQVLLYRSRQPCLFILECQFSFPFFWSALLCAIQQ